MFKVVVISSRMSQTIATSLESPEDCFRFIKDFANELCWQISIEDRFNRFAIGVHGVKVITFKVEPMTYEDRDPPLHGVPYL